MNIRIFYFGFMIFLASVIMFSCDQKHEITENKIGLDTISIVKVYHLDNDSTQPSCNLKIGFVYPSSYKDDSILESVRKGFIDNFFDESYAQLPPQEAVDKYAENYINNYKEDARVFFKEKINDFSEDSSADNYFSYYEKISNEITFNKSGLLATRICQTNFKGGSNSFQQYANYVYDLTKGKYLTEEDIFNEGYEKVLNRVFKDKLLAINKVETINNLEDLGYFGIEEIMPNNNFLIEEKGITYTFNKGEYSALQLDEINLFIPYEEIMPILKEKSPISVFFE